MGIASIFKNDAGRHTNVTYTLFCNLLLSYVALFVCRLIFVAVNYDLYGVAIQNNDLWLMVKGSLLFDTAAVCYLNLAYIFVLLFPLHIKEGKLTQTICKYLYIIPNSIGIIANLCDCVYVPYTGRRTTWSVFSEFSNEGNMIAVIGTEIIGHWWLVLGACILIWLMYRLYMPSRSSIAPLGRYYVNHTVLLCFLSLFLFLGMRGNIGKDIFMISSHVVRPLSMSSANQYVASPTETPIVLNTPYCIIRTVGKVPFSEKNYFSSDELDKTYSPIHVSCSNAEGRKKNVVILIVESFGKEYIGIFNPRYDGSLTPFLDSLISKSHSYLYSYGNGKKSIDGMPSILSSIPMLVEPFFLTPFSLNKVSGIAGELSKIGYSSAFFHGAPNSSMGFQAFAKATSFQSYYGLDEYCLSPNHNGMGDYDGTWAIWDEPFLQYFVEEMNKMNEPFVTSAFTATSHHPFNIPNEYIETYKDGTDPFFKCVRYTDHALKRFFEKASQQDWYANTLFVITADHTNHNIGPRYMTSSGGFEVPIVFFVPDGSAPFEPMMDSVTIAQQIDIMPTILDYVGYGGPYVAFGKSLVSTSSDDAYAINYTNEVFQYYKGDYLLLFDGEVSVALYNIRKDPLMKENVIGKTAVHHKMENDLKAIIQQYMTRMINDRLTVDADMQSD